MEFVLLPYNRGNLPTVPRTPYVCHQRYDGGPFLSYPMRVGKAEAGAASFDLLDYHRSERVNPTPIRDLESFVQTWLYFGFVSEFLLANTQGTSDEASAFWPAPSGSKELMDRIYEMMVVKEGDTEYVTLDDKGLVEMLETARARGPKEREDRIKFYDHLLLCLAHANSILSSLPREFNHAVKFAIAGLCELVAQAIRTAFSTMGIQRIFGRGWAVGYLNQEVKNDMIARGWCPSDIARAEAKFLSIQAIHVVRFMDKSLPKRDHTRCTETACSTYQINMGEYKVGHEQADCLCAELLVDHKKLEEILHIGDSVPLLRLTGDMQNLKVELVQSTADTPYIAISHVWADGMGNPYANSLHRCKLARLRELVAAVSKETAEPTTDPQIPLIWLDTLCCPAKDGEGKQKAIEKIRVVYQRAKHVLVLDTGLINYESKTIGVHERIVRIFTSGWVRRLWTLQEGALAKSLYFQFADEAVSLEGLRESFSNYAVSMRHMIFFLDTVQEIWRLDAFFRFDQRNIPGPNPSLTMVDQALQFRSVSVASDEPLCIGTLMSLDLSAILKVEPKDRMQKVWELLSVKFGGVPAQVIFFEEERIDTPGWRWAPKSLLSVDKSIHKVNVRLVKWGEPQLGLPTQRGLQVRFPGFRISISKYEDGRPRHPWPGLKRIAESYMLFREAETGAWFRISDKKYAYLSGQWRTEEERQAYNKLELFPLHDVADTGEAVLVFKEREASMSALREAIFAIPNPTTDRSTEGQEEGIAVKTERHVIIAPLRSEDGYIYDVINRLALRLRDEELTDKHLKLRDQLAEEAGNEWEVLKLKMQENEEFKESIKGLRQKMKDITAEEIKQNDRFVAAIKTYFGSSFLEDIWVLIQDWFNHDFVGSKIDSEQVWYVD